MSDSQSPDTNGFGHQPSRSRDSASDRDSDRDDADLFGDGDDSAAEEQSRRRRIDDPELDSSDDEERQDRAVANTVEDELEDDDDAVRYEIQIIPAQLARVRAPEADELLLLNMPPFLGLEQKNFDPDTYEAPTQPHDASQQSASAKFSAFSTAMTTLHWRHDPQNPSKLQSNSRIIRWSDGSLTLQVASKPQDQYRISTTALRQTFGKPKTVQVPYDPSKDSNVYLAAPHYATEMLQVVRPLDAALRILPTGDLADESVLKLQASLAAATSGLHDPLTQLKQVKEDPEMAKKAAELFEKDRQRSIRKRELAEEKQILRKERVLGRTGFGRSGLGGLTVDGLEGDGDGMALGRGGRSGGVKRKTKRKNYNRRGDIYSDDEDEDLPRGRTREDEYDLDDGFMAASDEEPEVYGSDEDAEAEDDPDVDDLEIQGTQTLVDSRTRNERERARSTTPKRRAAHSDDEDEVTLQKNVMGSPGQARKKRRVIDDDDDDE